jgi:WhiB family redox-sensing transcriptional regulator
MTRSLSVATVNEIRRLGRLGARPTSIARVTGASHTAVKKYLATDPRTPLDDEGRDDWRDQARCATDKWAFWGPLATVRDAKRVCSVCPVIDTCLEHALDNGEMGDDVWGGYTRDERAEMLRRRAS